MLLVLNELVVLSFCKLLTWSSFC